MKKQLRQYAIHIGRATWRVSRWTLYVSAAVLLLLIVGLISARFLLPMIAERKSDLEQYLSQRSGHEVRIESLQAYWDGLHPGARVRGLQVYAADGVRPAIRLSEVRLSLALMPLLWKKFEINSLVVANPSLALERLADGRFRVSGFDPMQAGERGADEKFVSWLFQQGRLQIKDGEVQWFDHRETGSALHLKRVNMSLRNDGDRHQIEFSAEFPAGMCDDCSLAFDIQGNPLTSAEWDGAAHVRAGHMNVKALPLIVREKLPPAFQGKFRLQLKSGWREGHPASLKGNVRVADLRLPVAGWDRPLEVREASGDISWETKRDGWRLDVANPLLGLSGPAWAGGHLRIVHQPEESEIHIKHVDLADLTGFLTRLKNEIVESAKAAPDKTDEVVDAWLVAKPAGTIKNFRLQVVGDWKAPADFSLETDVSDISLLPYKKYPGVHGLEGHLSLARDSGNFRLDANDMKFTLPQVFRQPLAARQVSGDISWQRYDDYWLVNGQSLRVVAEDGRGVGKLSLRLPHDRTLSPLLRLRVDFEDGNGAQAAKYYPASRLKPKTLAWMERSFIGGEITEGYLVYDGPTRNFPFDDGSGKFELRGHVRRGVYSFLPGWEPVRQAEVDVAIDNSTVIVTGVGKIGKLDATQVVVQSRKSGAENIMSGRKSEASRDSFYVVQVGGKVRGPLNETLNVLREVKPKSGRGAWQVFLPPELQGSGEGILSLSLTIPLGDAPSTDIQGEYRFLKNSLRFNGIAAEEIEGNVRFSDSGLREGNLRTRLLGGETVLAVARLGEELVVQGRGAITSQGLAPLAGPKLAPRFSGSAAWTGTWRQGKDKFDLRAEADLSGLKVSLPAPLNRPEGLAAEKLLVRTESSRRDGAVVALSMGNRLQGKLALERRETGWRFAGARLNFGGAAATLPKSADVQIMLGIDELDVDQWEPLLGDGSANAVPSWLARVSAQVNAFSMLDRRFGNISFDFWRDRDAWQGTINGASMAGNARFSGKGATARWDLDLAHLVLPNKQHARRDASVDPRHLPTVSLRSKSFSLPDKALGELEFMAEHETAGWRLTRLNLTRPDMNLQASGNWRFDGRHHKSDFNVEFSSSDMGKTMEAFGAPGQLSKGEVSIRSRLWWQGSPTNVQPAALNGKVKLTAKKGRFVQVKPGAGRLFGLLDLSAISRYLLLDFTPVFGKGLLYDRIEGEINIERGNAYTNGLFIRGPAMQLDIGGRVGLAAEDFDLTIELEPQLSDSVTIATWGVLGPQVAAAVLAVQKIFKKQIAAGTRITYVVKGPWDNPIINKLVRGDTGAVPASPGQTDAGAPVQ